MIASLYANFCFPDAACLGKRVFKTLFHEYALLTAADKSALTDDVDTIIWAYTLKPGTVAIQPYVDDQREYLEVAILQVDLKTQKRTTRLNEVIHRAIPYPVLIIFVFGSMAAFGVAHKRFGQSRKSEIVAEGLELTDWIDLDAPSELQAAFLASLRMREQPQTHFFAFYSGLVDRVIALECARLSGVYRIEPAGEKRLQRRQRLATCHELETQVAERRAAAASESQVNRLVDLNLAIKQLEGELARAASQL